jgi:hypothetical protein
MLVASTDAYLDALMDGFNGTASFLGQDLPAPL